MSNPYWRYVTKLAAYGGGGGPRKWRCNFCGIEKTGTVTRVKDHLGHVLGKDIEPCASVTDDVKSGLAVWKATRMNLCNLGEDINAEVDTNTSQSQGEASSKRCRKVSPSPTVSAHVSSTTSGGPSAIRSPLPTVDVSTSLSRKGSLHAASMKAGLQKQAMQLATREVTRLFIRCAIPFNVARTNQWKKTMKAVSRIGSIAPVHDMRGRQRRRGRQPPDVGTRAAAGASDFSSSASSEESHEDQVDDETGDDTEDSDA
ncbi:hypothetical protein L7F22_012358 [Adiantum nelumboides]|nr:hypothetical protein [Adiantum nelumboides]